MWSRRVRYAMTQQQIDAIVAAVPKVEYDPNRELGSFIAHSTLYNWGAEDQRFLLAKQGYRQDALKEVHSKIEGVEIPYPQNVFPDMDLGEVSKLLQEHDICPDRVFGNWGRMVFNNTIRAILKELE